MLLYIITYIENEVHRFFIKQCIVFRYEAVKRLSDIPIINCVVKPTALAVGYKTRPSNLRK